MKFYFSYEMKKIIKDFNPLFFGFKFIALLSSNQWPRVYGMALQICFSKYGI
jgi:hypothetical protein